MEILFADPMTTILVIVAVVVVILTVRGQVARRRAAQQQTSASWAPGLAEGGEGELPEPHRFGWVGEHPAILVNSHDRALGSTVKAALELRQKGNMAEAVRLLRACFIRHQNTVEEQAALLILIGNCFLAQGRLEPAAGHFREAAELVQQSLSRN